MDELKNWLLSLGHAPQGLNLDGKFVRFGKEKEFWVWAKQFEFPRARGSKIVVSASFGNWKTGEKIKWSTASRLPKHESELITNEMNRQIELDRAEREKEYKAVADKAYKQFKTYSWAASTPYTERKKIEVDPKCRVSGDLLIVPMYDVEGKFWSYQTINPDGEKRFFTGGKKRGNFFAIGELTKEIIICEGYATGYSLHKSTGKCVVVAFDAGSLPPVAAALRAKDKDLKITFAADRDESGVGEKKARQAAESVGGEIILPPSGFKDFNDAGGMLADVEGEVVGPYPNEDETGKRLSTIENMQEMLNRYKVVVRYNVINKTEEVLIPGESFSLDNRANAALARVQSFASIELLPKDNIKSFLCYLGDRNPHNPVVNWINSKPWDGVDRLTDFYATVRAQDTALRDILIRRWLVSAIVAAYAPNGISAHGVLVFQGLQNAGKTHWFKKLAPPELNVIRDGLILKPDDRDSVKQAISNWLVELGELDATFKKSDIAQLKAFITKDRDVMRTAYAEKESEFARRTIFFGSVNEKEFLNDTTGNRRFWTIECDSIDYKHTIDMQQVWAQVHDLWKRGESYILSPDELDMLNASNKQFEAVDPIDEMVHTNFHWDAAHRLWHYKTATDCALAIGIKNPDTRQRRILAKALRRMKGVEAKKMEHTTMFKVPPIVSKLLDFT